MPPSRHDWQAVTTQQTQQRVELVDRLLGQAAELEVPEAAEFQLLKLTDPSNTLDRSALHALHLLERLPGAAKGVSLLQDPKLVGEWLENLLDDVFAQVDLACDETHAAAERRLTLDQAQPTIPQATLAAAEPEQKPQQPVLQSKLTSGASKANKALKHDAHMHAVNQAAAANLPKPQDSFANPLDNSNIPFVPYWSLPGQEHDNASEQLPGGHLKALGVGERLPHAGALEALSYPAQQLQPAPPQPPQGMEVTPFTLVTTPQQLADMVQHLSTAAELAVDLEHHSFRSFQGFTCLLQLSTRTQDFVVDTLCLRSQLGAALAPIFADPRVVKVLHGAESDIAWLQRDFGIFLVNLFDTHQAGIVLGYPHLGLAYLLQHFCHVQTDKRYQLADWRLRPLPEDMLLYARMDTHFLLFIYDRLKEELLKLDGSHTPPGEGVVLQGVPTSALRGVLERSRALCLLRYEKELFTESSYLASCPPGMSAKQEAVFAGLYAWRDRVAREQDESCGYVLPRAVLQRVSRALPATINSLCGCLSGHRGHQASSNALADELLPVIAAAREQAPALQQRRPALRHKLVHTTPAQHSVFPEVAEQAAASPQQEADMGSAENATGSAAQAEDQQLGKWAAVPKGSEQMPAAHAEPSSSEMASAVQPHRQRGGISVGTGFKARSLTPLSVRGRGDAVPSATAASISAAALRTSSSPDAASAAAHALQPAELPAAVQHAGRQSQEQLRAAAVPSAMPSRGFTAKRGIKLSSGSALGRAMASKQPPAAPMSKEDEAAQAAAAIRATLSLPQASLTPVVADHAAQLPSQQPQSVQSDELQQVSGAEVRAALDAMQAGQPATSALVTRAESPQQPQRPHLPRDDFFGDDFLPLSISDQHRRPADRRQAEPLSRLDSSKRQRVEAQQAQQAQQQHLQAAGLLSDSEADSSSGDDDSAPGVPEVIPLSKGAKSHTRFDDNAGSEGGKPLQHLGPTFPVDASATEDPGTDLRESGQVGRQQNGSYDFAAAQARHPGLSLNGSGDRGVVRDSRGQGRRAKRQDGVGRGAVQKPGLPRRQGFDPYAIQEAKSRGVRRSAVTPRSGNKSRTFK